jgi:hypothetical protein
LLVIASQPAAEAARSQGGKKGKKTRRVQTGNESGIFSAARFTQLPGWEKEEVRTPSDPHVTFSLGVDTIKVRLLGGGGSRYASEEGFLKGFEATTMGRPPEVVRQVKVAGRETPVYRHGYPIMLGDPHILDPRPPRLATEEFVILPLGRKFFVLSWAHESPVPDPDAAADKVWAEFLDSFTLKPAAVSRNHR